MITSQAICSAVVINMLEETTNMSNTPKNLGTQSYRINECDKQSCLSMGPLAVNSSVSEVKIYLLCRAFFSSTCTMPSSTTRLTFVGGPNFQDADVLSLGGGCFDWAESLEELHFHGIRAGVNESSRVIAPLPKLENLPIILCLTTRCGRP
ncbi:hypothetical protein DPMN_113454 [Dreissena polymorpha]|uniref:Uncharacterized protein n=1 Tax=Dreissena polymorpha TaxID=45954 RepID=A0A9D4QR06_DREPO|nr:hypothetical protein DPMN_113452 [Dreissena polymorpha]KAH3840013.1 hypothetical protein DPMN_113454 [Dreissena polymorpha]